MSTTLTRPTVAEIKAAAKGKWVAILQAAGISIDILDAKGHPCPKCNGTDRFEASKDVETTGNIYCRGCFNKDSDIRPGDGIASVAWIRGITNGQAIKWVCDHLGLSGTKPIEVDIIQAVATDKRMPLDAFLQFGPYAAKRGKRTVARVPAYNQAGEVFSYFDLTPGDKGWFARGEGMSGMFFPGRLPQAGETWLLVEGVKDAAALIGLGFNSAGLPSSFMADKYSRLFDGVNVVIVPDLDTTGQNGAKRTGAHLAGIAKSIRVARLPGEVVESGGKDVRDTLRRSDGVELVRDAIANAKAWEPSEGDTTKDGRPEVFVTLTEGFVADQVVKHIGKLGWASPWIPEYKRESVKVFARGGVLVQAVESEDPNNIGQLAIRAIPSPIVRERITQACQLLVEEVSGDDIEVKPKRPDKWLIDAVHLRGSYQGDVKPLVGVIQSPTIRADGSILQVPGYDEKTGLLYRPTTQFPRVPENPTKEDAKKAFDKLCEVVVDFPFLEDADCSAWVCMFLSMIGRSCIVGCVPMFVVTSNNRGSGKSLTVDTASTISYGRTAARKAFTREENELRKSITAIAIEGIPSVLFDNLDVQLGGASLDAVLTAESWSDRVLGSSSTTGDLPIKTVFCVTGNNVVFGSDVARRVLPIRLHTPLETPEDRTGFVHPDLLQWVRDNRPELAVAGLTLLRAYFVAGCPVQDSGTWGSYESWSKIIRGAVVWCGGADPLPTRKTATENDDSKNLLSMLITGIEEADPNNEGVTVKTIERLTSHRVDELPTCPTLNEAVAEICGHKFNAKRFGQRLRSFKGRAWNGKKLVDMPGHGGVKRWSISLVGGGIGGNGGICLSVRVENSECIFPVQDTPVNTYAPVLELGEQKPPKPPYPPCPCPKCGEGLKVGPEVRGWVNLECTKCSYIKPTELAKVQA